MKITHWIIVSAGVVGLAVTVGLLWPQKKVVAPTTNTTKSTNSTNTNQVLINTNSTTSATTFFSTADLPDRDAHYSFTVDIPSSWAAEYVPASQSINFFDPKASGDSSLEKSQIFVRFFEANTFQTLTTVDIKSTTSATVAGRPAMVYVIAKKSGVADFNAQPSWRNIEHTVTDIRAVDESPSTFYVFARRPELSTTIFSDIVESLKIISQQ